MQPASRRYRTVPPDLPGQAPPSERAPDQSAKALINGSGPSSGKIKAMVESGAVTWDVCDRTVPASQDTQPLQGPRKVPPRMVKMLRKMLAELHFGPNSDFTSVPEPLEAAYIDWSLPPFNAGYHEWASHYDVGDVQRKIRKPSQLVPDVDAQIFIVGEAYSNDQAWVEGAYCTAESVLNDFFDVAPIIDDRHYPFICPA